MAHVKVIGVNDGFRTLVNGFHTGRIGDTRLPLVSTPSTQGQCTRINEPVIITYSNPLQRVLYNEARDANPVFHLYEALHMLCGRNDLAPLAYYNSNMSKYSDDGKTLNGSAYGYRWRKHINRVTSTPAKLDQINIIIDHLRSNPYSRRAVLDMWNVENDLLKIGGEVITCTECKGQNGWAAGGSWGDCARCNGKGTIIDKGSLDVACNLSILFEIEMGMCRGCNGSGWKYAPTIYNHNMDGIECEHCKKMPHDQPRYLNMTVLNRSNDLIWGTMGANFVHFTILLEYMAAHLGLDVGVYNQISNNLHVYESRFKAEEWLVDDTPDYYTNGDKLELIPLIRNTETFNQEVVAFVNRHVNGDNRHKPVVWTEPFLEEVAEPMMNAFHAYKHNEANWLTWITHIDADDWRISTTNWIKKRMDKRSKA